MTFKDIKQNFPIYLLDTSKCEILKGKVIGTSFPHLDTSNTNTQSVNPVINPCIYPQSSQPQNSQRMVIDLTIEVEGKTATYIVGENASINYANNLIIAADQASLIPEVEAIRNHADEALSPNRLESLKQQRNKAVELLMNLNPSFKQQQEYDKRLDNVESSLGELKDMMTNFIKEFKG